MKYIKKNNKYYNKNKEITNKNLIDYFNKYKIPPAWKNVQIYPVNSNKIFCTGVDVAGRKQYIYKANFVKKQKNKKYCNLIKFSEKLPNILKVINKNLTKKWSKDKIIALILKIMIHCNFRIGNEIYKKKYKSFGLTTLQKKHIKFNKNNIKIKFIGKKGVLNECTIVDPEIIKNMPIRSSTDYFTYKNNKIKAIDINNFLKQFGNFTSKDFRTWSANMLLLKYLINSKIKNNKERKKNAVKIVKQTSSDLHHTPSICKKSYIHPQILKLYIEQPNKFNNYYMNNNSINKNFIKFLKKYC